MIAKENSMTNKYTAFENYFQGLPSKEKNRLILCADRINAMKTLTFSRDINKFQFILVLVDYNENSKLLDLTSLENLPFASQIKVFHAGFGMWHHNVKPIT
jgi:hypothetical protein